MGRKHVKMSFEGNIKCRFHFYHCPGAVEAHLLFDSLRHLLLLLEAIERCGKVLLSYASCLYHHPSSALFHYAPDVI